METNKTTTLFSCVVIFVLLAANKLPSTSKKIEFSPYQLMIWELKANEGYVPHWYKDGYVNGKQAYSIGFGWNDQGQIRRKEAKPYLDKNGKISFDNATKLTCYEISKYGRLHADPYKNLALQLYSYARGLTKTGSSLGRCCGAGKGCGNKNKNIRKSHNRRRKFELALWHHDFETVKEMTFQNQQKIKIILSQIKK